MRTCLPRLAIFAAIALSSAGAHADWKSFIHGDPPPIVKAAPPKQLAIVSTAAAVESDAQIEGFMRALAAAIMARDGAGIAPRLSATYAIEGLPDDLKAADFMSQAIATIRGPTEMVILSVEKAGDARVAKVELRYDPPKASVKTFRFDSSGKLLSSDLFRLSRVGS